MQHSVAPCKISGTHSGVDEDSCLPNCYVLSTGKHGVTSEKTRNFILTCTGSFLKTASSWFAATNAIKPLSHRTPENSNNALNVFLLVLSDIEAEGAKFLRSVWYSNPHDTAQQPKGLEISCMYELPNCTWYRDVFCLLHCYPSVLNHTV